MRKTLLLLIPTLLAMGACNDDGGTGSSAGGEYVATLESPNGVEGAALIELTGAGIQAVADAPGLAGVHAQVAGGTARVVVVREPAGPIAFRVTMARGSEPPAARVVEVVDGADQPRTALGGYRVTFSR